MIHEKFMHSALLQAQIAYKNGETPVGAVVVHNGKIISRGRNRREQKRSPLCHAEIEALNKAAARLKDWRMNDCQLYVTLEPCPMCAGAILAARIQTVIFGAYDPQAGACGSVFDMFDGRILPRPEIISGVLEDESKNLLQTFFKEIREKRAAEKLRKAL